MGEYLVDLNATQAAIRAGYSKKTARSIAAENLAKPYIQEKIAEAKRERSEVARIDAEWVLTQAVELFQRCMQEIIVSDESRCQGSNCGAVSAATKTITRKAMSQATQRLACVTLLPRSMRPRS